MINALQHYIFLVLVSVIALAKNYAQVSPVLKVLCQPDTILQLLRNSIRTYFTPECLAEFDCDGHLWNRSHWGKRECRLPGAWHIRVNIGNGVVVASDFSGFSATFMTSQLEIHTPPSHFNHQQQSGDLSSQRNTFEDEAKVFFLRCQGKISNTPPYGQYLALMTKSSRL